MFLDIFILSVFQLLGTDYVLFIPDEYFGIIRFFVLVMSIVFVTSMGIAIESTRKRTQDQLETALKELQITNQQLQLANEAAEAATKAKSEFLANMSHEIRTPLNGIIGIAGLLSGTVLDEEQQAYGQIIQSSGDALLEIINSILDFSKIEAGKLDLEAEPFDLRQTVEDSLDLVTPKATNKGLELGYSMAANIPPFFVGDAMRFRQIMLNLLGNAVKFTERGEVMVFVTGEEAGNGRYRLHISVNDTGIGIPAERINALFQSFNQVDSSTTRKFGGTGLGLAISKRLADLMDGEMWVESEEGVGSTFHFTVLLETADLGPKSEYLQDNQPDLLHKRILILDDNATSRSILNRQMTNWGMSCLEAESAKAALDLLHAGESFDVALVDEKMPDTSGTAFAQLLPQQFPNMRLPLILLTSPGQQHYDKKHLFADFLTKPIKPMYLFEILRDVLSSKQADPNEAMLQKTSTFSSIDNTVRVLLAENNRMNQQVGLSMLEKLGLQADLAVNGTEVLEALAIQSYDIILMDIQMPEMDGVEATRQIIEQFGAERPYIIALTANALDGHREAYLETGMDDYLSKPIKVELLHLALQKAVETRNALTISTL